MKMNLIIFTSIITTFTIFPMEVKELVQQEQARAIPSISVQKNEQDQSENKLVLSNDASKSTLRPLIKYGGIALAIGCGIALATYIAKNSNISFLSADKDLQDFFLNALSNAQQEQYEQMLTTIRTPLGLLDENNKFALDAASFKQTLTPDQALQLLVIFNKYPISSTQRFPLLSFQAKVMEKLALTNDEMVKKTVDRLNAITPVATFTVWQAKKIAVCTAKKIWASVQYDNAIVLWDMVSGKCIQLIKNLPAKIGKIEFDTTGSYIVSFTKNGFISVFDTQTARLVKKFQVSRYDDIAHFAFNADATVLAALSKKGALTIFSVDEKFNTNKINHTFEQNLTTVEGIAFDALNRLVLLKNDHKLLYIEDVKDQHVQIQEYPGTYNNLFVQQTGDLDLLTWPEKLVQRFSLAAEINARAQSNTNEAIVCSFCVGAHYMAVAYQDGKIQIFKQDSQMRELSYLAKTPAQGIFYFETDSKTAQKKDSFLLTWSRNSDGTIVQVLQLDKAAV